MICWGLAEDKAGMINQIRGLAEALGLDIDMRLIRRQAPWKLLPSGLWIRPLKAPAPGSDSLAPPWPDVAIGSGRYVAPILAAIKKASGGRTVTIYIQDPAMSPKHFDAVVVPEHDRCRGDNVWTTVGALHRITHNRLQQAAQQFRPQLSHLRRPLVAVCLAGPMAATVLRQPLRTAWHINCVKSAGNRRLAWQSPHPDELILRL